MTSVIESIKKKYSKIKPYTYLCNFVIFSFKIILFFITKSFSLAISSLYNAIIGIVMGLCAFIIGIINCSYNKIV